MSGKLIGQVQAEASISHPQTVSSYADAAKEASEEAFFSISMITEVFPSAERDASALLSTSFAKSLFKQDGTSLFALGLFFQQE